MGTQRSLEIVECIMSHMLDHARSQNSRIFYREAQTESPDAQVYPTSAYYATAAVGARAGDACGGGAWAVRARAVRGRCGVWGVGDAVRRYVAVR